jgi:hypothetical protein
MDDELITYAASISSRRRWTGNLPRRPVATSGVLKCRQRTFYAKPHKNRKTGMLLISAAVIKEIYVAREQRQSKRSDLSCVGKFTTLGVSSRISTVLYLVFIAASAVVWRLFSESLTREARCTHDVIVTVRWWQWRAVTRADAKVENRTQVYI